MFKTGKDIRLFVVVLKLWSTKIDPVSSSLKVAGIIKEYSFDVSSKLK